MKYYGKKLRNAVVDPAELEVLLFKQATFAALHSGNCCSYRGRYVLIWWADGYVINKADDPAATVSFRKNQLGSAVDAFVSQFINEENCDIGDVLFQSRMDGAGVPWRTLAANTPVSDLPDFNMFSLRLQATLGDMLDAVTYDQQAEEESDT